MVAKGGVGGRKLPAANPLLHFFASQGALVPVPHLKVCGTYGTGAVSKYFWHFWHFWHFAKPADMEWCFSFWHSARDWLPFRIDPRLEHSTAIFEALFETKKRSAADAFFFLSRVLPFVAE
jgi:hypothetical protein